MALAVVSVTHTAFTTDTTAHLVAMPATVNAGDLLITLIATDGSATLTTPSGWTNLSSVPQSTTVRGSCSYKIAVGTEGGTTVDYVTTAAEQAAAQVYRITGHLEIIGQLTAGTAVGSVNAGVATIDAPAVTAPWGVLSADNLFITYAATSGTQAIVNQPTGWSTPEKTNEGGAGQGAASAEMFSSWLFSPSATLDPASWTTSATGAVSLSNTIVIRPRIGTVGLPVSIVVGTTQTTGTTQALTIPVATAGNILLIQSHGRRASTTLAPGPPSLSDTSAAPLVWTEVFSPLPTQVGVNPGTAAQWWWAVADGDGKTVTVTWPNASTSVCIQSSVARFTIGAGLAPDFSNQAFAGSTGTPNAPVTATFPIAPTTGINMLSFAGAGGSSSTIATGYTSLAAVAASPYRTGYDMTPGADAVMGANFLDQMVAAVNIIEVPLPAPTSSLLTSYTPGSDRNDFTGGVGVRLGISTSSIPINWIGARRHHVSQTGLHTVWLYEWFGQTIERTAIINYDRVAVGEYAWTEVAPYTLLANGYYALIMETTASDGQTWCNPGPTTFTGMVNIYDSYLSGGALYAGTVNQQFIGLDAGYSAPPVHVTADATGEQVTVSVGGVTVAVGVGADADTNLVTASVGDVSITATTGGGWTPNIISGLEVWLDGSTLGLADGAAVSTWPNPGFGPDPSFVGSPSPVCKLSILDGKSVLRFTANEGRLRGTFSKQYGWTLVYLVRRWGATGGRAFTAPYPEGGNFLIGHHTSGYDCMHDDGGWLKTATTYPATGTDPWRMYSADNTTSVGVRFFINAANQSVPLGTAGNLGFRYNISGYDMTGTGETGDFDIAELLLYDSRLSDADRQAAEGYMAWKWGLEAILPSGHLYEDEPPGGPSLVNGFDVTPGLLLPIVFQTDNDTTIATINTTGPFADAIPAGYDDWYGAPDVTVNLAGQAVTVSAGTVTAAASVSTNVTTNLVTASVGTVSFQLGVSISVTSPGLTAQLGPVDIIAGGSISVGQTTNVVTASVGTVTIRQAVVFAATNLVTTSVGDETIRHGVSTTAATNLLTTSVGNESVIQGLGVSTTAATNLITASVGNETATAIQNMSIPIVMSSMMTVSTNPVTVVEGFRVLVNVTSPPMTASVGNESVAFPMTVYSTGNQVTASMGAITVIQPVTVNVTGQEVIADWGYAETYTVTNVSVTGFPMVVSLGDETISLPREVEAIGFELTAYAGSIDSFILNHNIVVEGYRLTVSHGLAHSPNWGTTPDDERKEDWMEPATGPGEGWVPLPKRENAWIVTPDVPDEIWNRQTHPPNEWTH